MEKLPFFQAAMAGLGSIGLMDWNCLFVQPTNMWSHGDTITIISSGYSFPVKTRSPQDLLLLFYKPRKC